MVSGLRDETFTLSQRLDNLYYMLCPRRKCLSYLCVTSKIIFNMSGQSSFSEKETRTEKFVCVSVFLWKQLFAYSNMNEASVCSGYLAKYIIVNVNCAIVISSLRIVKFH